MLSKPLRSSMNGRARSGKPSGSFRGMLLAPFCMRNANKKKPALKGSKGNIAKESQFDNIAHRAGMFMMASNA